jgi:alpha-N-arabinofuranosidase
MERRWPTILEKGKVVPTVVNKKGLQPIADSKLTGNFSYTDHFSGSKLDNRWMFLRNPSQFYTLGEDGLTIHPLPSNISQLESPSAIFCRQQHLDFTAQTTVSFSPKSDKDLAGFTLLQNEVFNFVFGKTMIGGKNGNHSEPR